MPKTYSNPRMRAEIPDWPSGSQRVTALFEIETDVKTGKQRALRTTTGTNNTPCAAKKLTYALQQRIVDGDDGRTYIIGLSIYGNISVFRGDMKIQEEAIFESDPRYSAMRALFTAGA